jgi:hypothetical protein
MGLKSNAESDCCLTPTQQLFSCIAILRRRLRDRARVRRRATRSWLLRRKQRSAYNTLLKELHTEDPNEFRNYFKENFDKVFDETLIVTTVKEIFDQKLLPTLME